MGNAGKLSVVIAIATPVYFAMWVLFVGTFSAHELEVGILATALAVAGTAFIDVQYPSRFQPSIRELLSVWRLPWYLLSGTWEIMKVALLDATGQHAKSLFVVVPFDAGKKNDERAVARRVLAVAYSTMTPPSVVLGINITDQELLVHQLQRDSVPKMLKTLGAKV